MNFFFGLCAGLAASWYLFRFLKTDSSDTPHYPSLQKQIPKDDCNPKLSTRTVEKQSQELNLSKDSFAVEPDDLTRLDGIGPKIATLLNKHGIDTYQQLRDFNVRRLATILKETKIRVRRTDPLSWSIQARLAAEGKWDDLKALQDKQRCERRSGLLPLLKAS